MTTHIRFLGIAGYEVVSPNYRLLLDPYLTGYAGAPVTPDDLETPDVILVSHAAWDHLGDTFAIAERTGAPVVGGADVRALLLDQGLPSDQVQAAIWGVRLRINGLEIIPVESHHWSQATLSDGTIVPGTPLAFIVEVEPGVRIYHFGDSAIFPGMELIGQLYRPTVAFVGCAQPRPLLSRIPGPAEIISGEMTPFEAALAVELLGSPIAVATHYIDTANPDVAEFLDAVGEADTTGNRIALAPSPGQVIVIDEDRAWIEPS